MITSVSIRKKNEDTFSLFKKWCKANDTSVSEQFDKMMWACLLDNGVPQENIILTQKMNGIKIAQKKLDDRINNITEEYCND